jgi:hypothetical protein
MSMFQQTVLAAETHLAEGLALKLLRAEKVVKSLMDLEGIRKLADYKMEGKAMLPLNALIKKTASICLLLMWRGRRSSFLYVLALLKKLV